MRHTLSRAAALLLSLVLLAALFAGCGGETAPTQVTPSVVRPGASDPEPTPETTPAPAVPTPEPREAVALSQAVGTWALYSAETEGDAVLAAETDIQSWLVIRDSGRADFAELQSGELTEQLNCPVAPGENGSLLLTLPEDPYGRTGEIVSAAEDELEISFEWQYPDSTPGGSTQIFRRVPEPEAQDTGTRVSAQELAALNAHLTPADEQGFFLCTYSNPLEIDWREVVYNGASILSEPSQAAMEEYERSEGLYDLQIVSFTEADLRAFVWEKALTSYANAQKPIYPQWFLSSDGFYIEEHGDTNLQPIEIESAYRSGEFYRLYYTRSDWQNYFFDEFPFVMTVRIHDGEWQYLSNLRADVPAPEMLLTIDYFDTKEEALAVFDVRDFTEPEQQDYEEPYGWHWAVLTARADGVRYAVDRAAMDYPASDYFLTCGAGYVGTNITSGELNAGESVAVWVNDPWYPTVRVAASKEAHWGEFWFGEDNGLHLSAGARRTVVAHDLAGEGRGCTPQTEDELCALLRDGAWFFVDPDTREPLCLLSLEGWYDFRLEGPDTWYEFNGQYVGEEPAPEYIVFDRRYRNDVDWDALPESFDGSDFLGQYYWNAYQYDGMQLLFLTQVSDGDGALSYLLPGATPDTDSFMFVRFRGAATEDS